MQFSWSQIINHKYKILIILNKANAILKVNPAENDSMLVNMFIGCPQHNFANTFSHNHHCHCFHHHHHHRQKCSKHNGFSSPEVPLDSITLDRGLVEEVLAR